MRDWGSVQLAARIIELQMSQRGAFVMLQHRRGRPVERDEGDHNAAQRHVLHRREPQAIHGVQLPSGGDKCFRAQQTQSSFLLHGDSA